MGLRFLLSLTGCLSILVLGGCESGIWAWPGFSADWSENAEKTGKALRVKGWGVCVDTQPLDGGVTLGGFDKTYYFPGEHSHDATISQWMEAMPLSAQAAEMAPNEPDDRDADGQLSKGPSAAALAVRSSSVGVTVHASEHQFGVTLGLKTRRAVILPKNGATYLEMQSLPDQAVANRLRIHHFPKPQESE